MSERSMARALERLAARNGVLAPERGGASYGVIANGVEGEGRAGAAGMGAEANWLDLPGERMSQWRGVG